MTTGLYIDKVGKRNGAPTIAFFVTKGRSYQKLDHVVHVQGPALIVAIDVYVNVHDATRYSRRSQLGVIGNVGSAKSNYCKKGASLTIKHPRTHSQEREEYNQIHVHIHNVFPNVHIHKHPIVICFTVWR